MNNRKTSVEYDTPILDRMIAARRVRTPGRISNALQDLGYTSYDSFEDALSNTNWFDEELQKNSDGVIGTIKNTTSKIAESVKNLKWSDVPDAFRMWTEGLVTLFKDESLEKIRERNDEQAQIQAMALYKHLHILKQDLEDKLNTVDINSNEASDIINQLNDVSNKISQYDQYFLTEGKNSDAVAQLMFDFDKARQSKYDGGEFSGAYDDKSYLYERYLLRDMPSMSASEYWKRPIRSFADYLYGTVLTASHAIDLVGDKIGSAIEHYVYGNGYKSDSYILGRAVGTLSPDDPVLNRLYKGNRANTSKDIANSIDVEAVGTYDKEGNYIPGQWYKNAERKKNEEKNNYDSYKKFLKDGKIQVFGSENDGLSLDIVDFEDINPQFRKEHEEYGSSFSDIIAHPLHGLVETNSTVGMLKYQLPQMGAGAISQFAAKRIPAIAAISAAAQPGLGLWGARQSRQEETATEAIDAITERVVKEVLNKGGDIQLITNQIVQNALNADVDISEYVYTKDNGKGGVNYVPKDEKSLQEILKIGTAFDFHTTDKVFEQAKKDSRKGINKLINANNALAVYDYIETLPFMSYWGSAMRESAASMSRKAVQNLLEKNVTKLTVGDNLRRKIFGGVELTPAQQKLLYDTNYTTTSLTDMAIDRATSKFLQGDIARALKTRDVAKYAANKIKLIGGVGVMEGLEEVNQTMLTNRYGRGEYDDYNKRVSMFDLNEIAENVALSFNGIGNILGINTSDPDNDDNELRKAFNIGFASSLLFSGTSHAARNLYGADDSNLSLLLILLKDDSTIGKVVAEQQQNIQDQVHLGMFYDALTRGKKSALYVRDRLNFLKQNIDKENSLVTDGFIDADKKLVDAMNLVLNNQNLKDIIDESSSKFNKKANKETGYDAKKRLYVNAAKAVADANTANELVNSLATDIENSTSALKFTINKLFSGEQLSDEQLELFEKENPKLYNTILLLSKDYEEYKQNVERQYRERKQKWADKRKQEWETQKKEQGITNFDDSSLEALVEQSMYDDAAYDEEQIDQMEKDLKDNTKFVQDPFVASIIRNTARGTSSTSYAERAKELSSGENKKQTIRQAYELKKSGYNERDFILDRVTGIVINQQKKAAETIQQQIKNQKNRLLLISELTGLDIDISRISGIEKAIDEIVKNYQEREKKMLPNGMTFSDLFGDEYLIDNDYVSQDALLGLMLAKAMSRPMNIRKSAYLYGSQNPMTVRDFLNSAINEEIASTAKEYAKIVDDLRNTLLSDDVAAIHDKEKELINLSKKAAKDLILSEIKDQEQRRYIANKRKDSDISIFSEQVESVDQTSTEEVKNVKQDQQEDNEASDVDVLTQSEGEKKVRAKFNGGEKMTKSEKLKKIKEQRDKVEKFKQGASGTNESIVDDEEDIDSILDQEDTELDVKNDIYQSIADNQESEPLESEEVLPQEQNEDDFEGEDRNNDSDDHENDESDEDIPNDPVEDDDTVYEGSDENNFDEAYTPSEYEGEDENISQQSQEDVLFEDQEDLDQFLIGGDENDFDGLSIEEDPDLSGKVVLIKENGDRANTELVEGQLEQLIEMENGTLDQNETSFDGTKKTVSEDTIGDMVSETLFYNPDPKDEHDNPIDEPIKLRVNGEDVKLPKPLASGRQLAKKLLLKNWFNKTKKYWIVTQSLESQNTRHTEKAKDTMTVCLIIEDNKNCYAVAYRQLGESHSIKKDSEGKIVEKYTTDKEQKLRDELYVKGMSWAKLIRLGEQVGILVQENEPKTARERAKIAKPIFEAYAKEIARGTFRGDPSLGRGSDSQFERWYKGLRPSEYKLKEDDPEYLIARDKRQSIIEESYEMARSAAMKGGRTPITVNQIDGQIERLRRNRNAVIDAYLTLVETKDGKKYFEFPKEVRTDVVPNSVSQSNGKINVNTIEGTTVHKFSNPMPGKTMNQIAESVENGDVVFGFGLGKFGSEYEAILKLFVPLTEKQLLTTADGRPIGVGKAGKIYMLVESPNGTQVPIMLRESKFDKQYREVNGKLEKVYLDDENAWRNNDQLGAKNKKQTLKFKECFEIDPNTGRPRLIEDSDGYKPSLAEILFYMVCGKFDTPNFKINSEYFIHNGEETLITDTDKLLSANEYLGAKQLYYGPIGLNGMPLQEQVRSSSSIPLSQYGLIIGMKNDFGVYERRVFMHDELFAMTPEAAQDRRDIIKAIATQMHWSMDSLLLTEHADINSFEEGFGSFVKHVLDQNKGKEECSFYGCPDLTFKRSDFQDSSSDGLASSKPVQYFAWCLANGKLQTDLNLEQPFYAPFVFGNGVKQTSKKIANDAAGKLGATENKPAVLTEPITTTEDDLMFKNSEYDEEYWKDFLGVRRKTMFERVKSFLKKDDEKKNLFDTLNMQAGAKQHGGFRDIIVFRFPKDNLSSEQALDYLDGKIKEFVDKYNSLHKDKTPVKYSREDLNQIKTRISSEYANKKALPVMNIYEDGSIKIYTRPMSGQFMTKNTEGFTGMYSTVRGSGKMNAEKSVKWLQKTLGINKDLIFVTKAILRGTHDEEIFGLTNASADAVRGGLMEDGFIVLSTRAGLGIEYHEGWHFVNLLLHDKQSRKALHEAYIKTHKKLQKSGTTYYDVEEAMAEDFRKWMLNQEATGIVGRIKRAFSRISDFLFYTLDKALYRSVYESIKAGNYSSVPLDQESVKEFHYRYDQFGGAYSKVHGIPSVSDDTLDSMTHVMTQNDFFETIDGIINVISSVLNLDSIDKIKSYSGRNFEEIILIVKDLRDSQIDDRNVGLLDDFINNPSVIKKALRDYMMSIGINFKVKKIKLTVQKLDGESELTEIEIGAGKEEEALQREENADNTWDKIDLSTSHKDNAALRAKMFLKRIPMLRRNYEPDGSVQYVEVVDRFGTPVYWKYDEVWNLIMNELWSCDKLDEKDKNGNYLPKTIRGEVEKLAKSNAMFYALNLKFDEIEGDIELRSLVFTTISASKNPVILGQVEDFVRRISHFDDASDAYTGVDADEADERTTSDSGAIADRKRMFVFNNDNSLLTARNILRTWSKNVSLNGLTTYNAKTKKTSINKTFVNSILKHKLDLLDLINKYKTRKLKRGERAYTQEELTIVLYGENGIREKFKQICAELGIPVDNDVVDAYISKFDESGENSTILGQINAFSSIMSNSNGSLSKIIDDVAKNTGNESIKGSDRRDREVDQLFNFYSENTNIGKLAIAYNEIHPQLSEYTVRDANGNAIYPINMPNELTDKTNDLNKDSKLAQEMSKSKLCEDSVILNASKKVDKNQPGTQLRLNTFAGLRDNNAGVGADHAGLTALEDVLCKMFLTEMDHIVFPTMADKKTWQSLSSSNIRLSHDLILCGPKRIDEERAAVEEYKNVEEYDESKYKNYNQYKTKAYNWYISLPEDSEVKQKIYNSALEVSATKGQMTYKRFSDETLYRFAKLFLNEINALIDYYDESHIANLVSDPNKLIENFHGNVSNGRMDFSGNGGKFRYFYDAYVSKDFAFATPGMTGDAIANALDMNLNQKLNALYELQKQIESSDGVSRYYIDEKGQRLSDPAFSKLTTMQAFGKTKDQCDGFELIREFLKDLKKEVIKNGEFTQVVLDSVNDKLIRLTEKSLQLFSQPGDIMQLIEKDRQTGLYRPTKIPALLLKPYVDKLIKAGLISEYASVYSLDPTNDDKFAEMQAVYSLIANFTINTALSVMEIEKVYTGEKAAYKWKKSKSVLPVRLANYRIGDSLIDVTVDVETVEDVFSDKIKRLGGSQSPGNKLRPDFNDDELAFDPTLKGNKYTVCNVNDIEVPSPHLDVIYQLFKTQLVVDRVRRGDIPTFESYVKELIQRRKSENESLLEQGKAQKSDLTKERVIDRFYNNFALVNTIYAQLSENDQRYIDEELASQMKPYMNITVADAQVFIRPALYRKIRIRLGEWTIEPDESGYSDEIAYKICETDDEWMKDPKKNMLVAKFLLNALKMSYFQNDPYDDAGMNINKAIYNKMALFPLFKMHRSSEIGRMLYDRMNLAGQEIDQIAFKSAVKVGGAKKAPSISGKVDGIEKYVEQKFGITSSKWKRLSQTQKLKYWIEGGKNSDGEDVPGYVNSEEFDQVRTAISKLDERFNVVENNGNLVAKRQNQYSIDYTTDIVSENKSTEVLPISVQDLRKIRLQLNTKAHEMDTRSIGTQMFKLAFSNIIDNAEYGTGKSGRQSRPGYKIKADIIKCIIRLTNIGIDEIRNEFYDNDGKLNERAVVNYVKTIAINNGLDDTAQQLLAEGAVAAALMSRSVFELSVSKYVNKKIVDINTKGGTAIQQSVFGFAGYGNDNVSTYYGGVYRRYNEGKELNWNAKEGSMEVLLSMNFFRPVVPRNVWALGHEARRQWLINNDIINGTKSDGSKSNPNPFGIGYRIPTQGMSSMFAYIVADVLPEQVGDLIVVPREFTAQTGSDFDVDKIYLANYSYSITDTESHREVENGNDEDTAGAIGNTLLDDYIDIISDRRNFANARASIDVITNTIQSELLPVLRGSSNQYIEGMTELMPYFQTLRKLEFGVGKTGIGPFALNVTNLALTQFMHLTMNFEQVGEDFNLQTLDSIEGQDGRRISDWLSAMVNAHVDVAKDAYVRDLNVNQFTYNHANLLLRCGKGITAFSFLAQPALKMLADYMNNTGGVYGENIDGSTPNQISKANRKKLFERNLYGRYRYLLELYLNSDKLSSSNRADAIKTIEWIRRNYPRSEEYEDVKKEKDDKDIKAPTLPVEPKDMFDFEKASRSISALRKSSDVNELVLAYIYQVQAINSFERLDKYAQSLSELVQCSQIDTKKFGNTISQHKNFVNKLSKFLAKNDLWVINDPEFISTVPIRQGKLKPEKADVSYMALKKYFESMYLNKKLNAAVKYTKGILEHQLFFATDAYDDIFKTICYTIFGKDEVTCIDGKTYTTYGTIYDDETVKAISGAIDDIIRYNVFMNQGPKSLRLIREKNNNLALDFIHDGREYIRQNMKRLLFGDDKQESIFNRVAKLIKDIKKNPNAKDGYIDLVNENGEISNQFLLYLSPQTANNNYPVGRMLLSTSQMNTSMYTKRQLMSGFDQLLSSEDEEIRSIAEDLAFYAYFSTYDLNVVNGFFDLVPPDYRKQYDSALKYTLGHNHKINALSAITSAPYSIERWKEDRASVESDMVRIAANEILDIMSRNFWYNDNIVQRFFSVYEGKDKNSFNKKNGDIIPPGIYDPQSQRSFLPWIGTTRSNSLYIKVKKGKTTMLYKKVGVVSRTESGKENPGVTEFNIYAVVQKAGLHKGKINQYEFYCNANTPSLFEDNQIIDLDFALDRVEKSILGYLKMVEKDSKHTYEFNFIDGPEIDPMYVSTNSETYFQDPTRAKKEHSNEQQTVYAKFEKSSSSADRKGVQNADWIINLVTEDKGAEVNRSVSKPLQEVENISDATLNSNTQLIVEQIVNSGRQDITIYITSTFESGLLASEEELSQLKQEKRKQYVYANQNFDNVQELADKYVESLSDYDLNEEILEKKISAFLDCLVYDLKIAGVSVKQLSAPLGINRKPVAFSVIAAHKTHQDFFNDSKAIIYPVDKFVNAHKRQFNEFLTKVLSMIEDNPVTEDAVSIQEDAEAIVKSVEKQEQKKAQKAKENMQKHVSADNGEQSLTNKNKFASAITEDDILLESSEDSSLDHENC